MANVGNPPKKNTIPLVKQYLTPKILNELRQLKTKNGFTLDQAIQSGIENPDSSIGIYAGDSESYVLFFKIFKPVIEAYHGWSVEKIHPGDLSMLDLDIGQGLRDLNIWDADMTGPYTNPLIDHTAKTATPDPFDPEILSFRIRIARNLADFPFPPLINSRDRSRVEELAVNALLKLKGDLKGTYTPLEKLSDSQRKSLDRQHLLFGKGDRFMESAGINRDWPSSRGIFVSDDHKFAVWINEEDHLRIISMDNIGIQKDRIQKDGIQKDGNQKEVIKTTCNRISRAMDFLGKELIFAHDPHLGFLTSCPSNLGTGMRAGVHICLPNFKHREKEIHEKAKKYNLQIRGTLGEKTCVENNVVDISNKQRLGITEKQCIATIVNVLKF